MNNRLLEYSVLFISLVITLLIGLYCSRTGRTSLTEYMLGSRRLTVLPILLSSIATSLTGSTMTVWAQETYQYGMQMWVRAVTTVLAGVGATWVYVPVSFNVKSASSFAYFDQRFNGKIRKFASIVYVFDTIQNTAMSQYVPSLTVAQMTGLPLHPLAFSFSLICVIYTASGGLKAVAWADSFQAFIFTLSGAAIFCISIYKAGGISEAWEKADAGGRLDFWSLDPSPFIRYSVWIFLVQSLFIPVEEQLSAPFHQRIVSVQTIQQAKKITLWSAIFCGIFNLAMGFLGVVIFAYFSGCDPVLANQGIKSHGTILPYFLQTVSDSVPGLQGLFLAGVVATGFSTVTSCWNTVACTFYEDILKPILGHKISDKTSIRILFGIVVVTAVISTSFIFLIEQIESLADAILLFKSITTSIMFVLYNGGMFLPWINTQGILAGSMVSGAITLYIVQGVIRYKAAHLVEDIPKLMTTANCMVNGTTMAALNMTITLGVESYDLVTFRDPEVPKIFSISQRLYSVPGFVIGLIVALIVSFIFDRKDLRALDPKLIVPQMRWVLPQETGALFELPEDIIPLNTYVKEPTEEYKA